MTKLPKVRFAEDAEGEAVRQIVKGQHGVSGALKWDRINPFWLVAELDGRIVAALQTCPSRPVGRLEMLSLDRNLTVRQHAAVFKALVLAGMGLIKGHGAEQVQIFVPEDLTEYRTFLEGRDAVVVDTGFMLAKQLV
jgi:hypothetical protein